MDTDPDHGSTAARLRDGFERIALVLRADLWAAAGGAGLNPVQAQVLALLMARPEGLRPKDIAAHLAVSGPSMTDTIKALVRKALVSRMAGASDARSVVVRLTDAGQSAAAQVAGTSSHLATAIAMLPPDAQENLLLTQINLIRQLQEADAIPTQRLCISCHHFRANAHSGMTKPHHCAFINAAIGTRDLRLDCGDHEAATPEVQAATWAALKSALPTLQAQP